MPTRMCYLPVDATVKGFFLRTDDARTVTFRIGPESLALYDRQMRRVVEPGTFTIYVGTSSDDVIAAHFAVTGDVLVLAPAPSRYR